MKKSQRAKAVRTKRKSKNELPMALKKKTLTIVAWPELLNFLEHEASTSMIGGTPEEVARYLIVKGLDDRARERESNRRAINSAAASKHAWPLSK